MRLINFRAVINLQKFAMKNIITLTIAFYLISFSLKAQLIIPAFNEPTIFEAVSSDDEESMPVPFNNGTGFYFMRTYYGGSESDVIKGEDIWMSEQKKKGWENPYRLFREGDIEGSGSICGTSADGSRVYLMVIKYLENSTERKFGYLDKVGKGKWSEFVEIKIEDFKFEEKFYHFHMTEGEEVLLISMSQATNQLNEDLYVSRKENGKWEKPINLGKTINTNKIELSPFMSSDGNMLYFSSDGHGGLGESDIFVSRRLDESWTNWTEPANLGAPINSEHFDDYFVIANGNKVFFTSSRAEGNSSIYEAEANGEFRFAFGDSIIGQFIYKGLPAKNITIEIYDLEDNLLVELVTDEEGKFTYKKLSMDENFMVKIKADDGDDFVGIKMYLSNSEGKRYKRMIFTAGGLFVDGHKIKEKEQIQGVYVYESKPMKNQALILFDENGFVVDTIYTDENGKFVYEKIIYDNNFTLVPLEETDDFSMVDLYLTDAAGERTFTLANKNNQFAFISANELVKEVKKAPKEGDISKEDKTTSANAAILSQWNGMALERKTVYFEFAKNNLRNESEEKLTSLLKILEEYPKTKIELTGHTDAVGSESSNKLRGFERANSVKTYLVSKGIDKTAFLKLESNGELSPAQSNEGSKGRAKNRRVEIILK